MATMKFDGGCWTESWYYADGLGMLLQLDALDLIEAMQEIRLR